jgi:hypothetical protein
VLPNSDNLAKIFLQMWRRLDSGAAIILAKNVEIFFERYLKRKAIE